MAATATSVFVTMATAGNKAMIVQINHPPPSPSTIYAWPKDLTI